jgi:hypothetical protein
MPSLLVRAVAVTLASVVAGAPAPARAEPRPTAASAPPLRAAGSARVGDLVASEGGVAGVPGLVLARHVVEAAPGSAGALAKSRTIYLNRRGISVAPGASDSRTDRSSIVDRPRSVPPWSTSEATWSATKACVAAMFAPFAVTITDVDPGAAPHIEAVLGGAPGDLGLPANVGGVSPFTASCGVVERSIVFAFTAVLPASPQRICEVVAQEIAHSYGLDHELLAPDPMSYLPYAGSRAFQEAVAPCGELQPRPCGVTSVPCRAQQSSAALLRERAGVPDAAPPSVAITEPPAGTTVEPGFAIRAAAADDVGVESAILIVDGEPIEALEGTGPFAFTAPRDLAPGRHEIAVEATDGQHAARHAVQVTVAPARDGWLGLGCAAGGGAGGSGSLQGVLAGVAALTARRRRRQLTPPPRLPAARVLRG